MVDMLANAVITSTIITQHTASSAQLSPAQASVYVSTAVCGTGVCVLFCSVVSLLCLVVVLLVAETLKAGGVPRERETMGVGGGGEGWRTQRRQKLPQCHLPARRRREGGANS